MDREPPARSRSSASRRLAVRKTMNISRRSIFLGGSAFSLSGCFDRPWYEENPQQKAFLDGLQVLAKPALASNNPLRLEEAAKKSLELAAKTGAFGDWQGV